MREESKNEGVAQEDEEEKAACEGWDGGKERSEGRLPFITLRKNKNQALKSESKIIKEN